MKTNKEQPLGLDRIQEDRLKEIRDIEEKLYFNGRTMDSEEHSKLLTKMNMLTRNFLNVKYAE